MGIDVGVFTMASLTQGTKDTFVKALDQFMIRSGVINLTPDQQKTIAKAIPADSQKNFTWFTKKNDKYSIITPGQYTSDHFDTLVDFVRNNAPTLTLTQINRLIDDTKNIFQLVERDLSKVLKPSKDQGFNVSVPGMFKNLKDTLNPVFKDNQNIQEFIDYVNGLFTSISNYYIKSSILFLLAEIMKKAATQGFIKNPTQTLTVQAKPAVQASTHVGKIRPGKFIPWHEREYISAHYYREMGAKPYNRVRFSPTVRNRQGRRISV